MLREKNICTLAKKEEKKRSRSDFQKLKDPKFSSARIRLHRGIIQEDTCSYRSVREQTKRRNEQRAGRQVGAEPKRRYLGVARLAGKPMTRRKLPDS
ncbi:hypothetical protein NPIL_383921 [Nephila pilipes]|uniref:Uncharacterized protein n=1 Tax=Nephila pilipes TaxID=299642 RepID=A0A8X6MVL5_NEPPI|nr:hypothetical protein NPIL_383921 [Nephila pilipes]